MDTAAPSAPPAAPAAWYYFGTDHKEYGPFSVDAMLSWRPDFLFHDVKYFRKEHGAWKERSLEVIESDARFRSFLSTHDDDDNDGAGGTSHTPSAVGAGGHCTIDPLDEQCNFFFKQGYTLPDQEAAEAPWSRANDASKGAEAVNAGAYVSSGAMTTRAVNAPPIHTDFGIGTVGVGTAALAEVEAPPKVKKEDADPQRGIAKLGVGGKTAKGSPARESAQALT